MSIEGVPAPVHVRGHVLPRSDRVMAKGWIQAVVLVGIFGFTVLGFMAARTYQADPPIPDRVVVGVRRGAVHRRGRARWPGGVPPQRRDAVRLDLRPRRLPRTGLHGRLPASCRGRGRGGVRRRGDRRPPAHDRGLPHQHLRPGDEDGRLLRRAGRGLRAAGGALPRLLRQPGRRHRPATGRDRRSRRHPAADRVLLVERVGRGCGTAGQGLLVHQQLAARGARRQHADRRRRRVERAVTDRLAGRHRGPAGGVRTVELAGLARPRPAGAVVPGTGPGGAHPVAEGNSRVLPGDGGTVPGPDVGRGGQPALPGRDRRVLRRRQRPLPAVQHRAHLARAALDLLGRHVVPRRRHLPHPDDRRTQGATRPARARPPPPRRAGGRRRRKPARRARRDARVVRRPVVVVRDAGLRVPRPRPVLAGPAHARAGRSGSSCCGGGCAAGSRVEHRTNMPWLFFYAALALPAFYAVGLLAHPRASSRWPTSGASSSSTCGSRTSWSCSPP